MRPAWQSFGVELASFDRWSWPERLFIARWGSPDLSSRARFLAVREMLPDKAHNVLDLGCGNGLYSFFAGRLYAGAIIVGCDTDSERVAAATRAAEVVGARNVRFRATDITACMRECSSSSVDLVLAVESLQYVDNLAVTMHEVLRVLRPGGTFVVHVPVRANQLDHEKHRFDLRTLAAMVAEGRGTIVRAHYTLGWYHRIVVRTFNRLAAASAAAYVMYPVFLMLLQLRPNRYQHGHHLAVEIRR